MTAALTALGAIAVALVTLATFLIRRHDKHKPGVQRTAAEVAVAKDALGIIQSSRDTLKEDVDRLLAARETDRGRIGALETEMRSIRDGWLGWYDDLSTRWHHHREQPRPPRPPDFT